MWIEQSLIEGEHVALEPLTMGHVSELIEAVKDGEHWKLWFANVPSPEKMEQYVVDAIAQMHLGNIAYAVRAKTTNQVVGTTRYYGVDRPNRRALIGYTWYSNVARGTLINKECKYLLLKQIFERYEAIAVEFRTHIGNAVSRRAIEGLGANLDGILRNHQILKDGSVRDTVVYSIIDSEWPEVKQGFLKKLSQQEP
ncbi:MULTISPECIES: GNAT family N-acetyltransferase [Vibrio]|jgi:RimJ/RimL family protein N-acetyltransferase|uniref:GNAT family N-acetyltransferase n=1 Tax=Vibrio TaxID=662 RepID=UPI000808DB45|nr:MULTISPECIES: GNAT family protein [Vibrio]MBO7911389.1 GNAT family N-acetyltransferase [Vibrio sp. G41H]MBT9241511.1 GNAT family N-acetyltransferase [Vibrio splendidus]MCF7485020.1 GNAT family N-acetyltransferase [Vibrio sp. A2-1]MCF7490226.1 GNAT family N-acetyltransferase [Vibrio sp. G-C-1]MDP2614269.1 GNAT family protein [Vibrio splendidus]